MATTPSSTETCPCGEPLHYTEAGTEAIVRNMVAELGEFVLIRIPDGNYLVSRHFIALHGLSGDEVARVGTPAPEAL